MSQLRDMRLSLEDLFRPLGPEEELQPVALVELVAMTGLPAATLEALEAIGLLVPAATPEGKRYDGLDVRIARAARKLLDLGLSPSDLDFYGQYVEALRTEARVIREKVVRGPVEARRLSGSEVKETLDSLKASLAAKVYRQAALESRRREEGGERKSE